MRTSRDLGAVGENAVVPRVVRMFALPHHKILDYGAGKKALHAAALRTAGHNVTAYDYWGKKPEIAKLGLHDPHALSRRYDIVYASNVLNVQATTRHLAKTLNQIARSVDPATGMAIVNFPQTPRKNAFRGMTIQDANNKVEKALKRRFHHVERHPSSTGSSPVWIAKHPKNPAPSEVRELEDA